MSGLPVLSTVVRSPGCPPARPPASASFSAFLCRRPSARLVAPLDLSPTLEGNKAVTLKAVTRVRLRKPLVSRETRHPSSLERRRIRRSPGRRVWALRSRWIRTSLIWSFPPQSSPISYNQQDESIETEDIETHFGSIHFALFLGGFPSLLAAA